MILGETTNSTNLAALHTQLVAWLIDAAYPLWSTEGIDPANGGFVESIARTGHGQPHPRRARVHPRQIYAFAQAPRFGWQADITGIVTRGMAYFVDHYRRSDGLFRTLADVEGKALDERALLYDQAFALLGFAAAAAALGACEDYERQALALRDQIERTLYFGDGAFRSCDTGDGWLESNPHMHLLEACLAWADLGSDASWAVWATQLAGLACAHFVRRGSGALGEAYAPSWEPAPERLGRIIEPGHQFEWAWLLLRCERKGLIEARGVALRLINIGEESGVRRGVAINALWDDFSVEDANARFWPQTERLKAALLAAEVTGERRFVSIAAAAAASLLPYLATPVAGLWFDVQRPDGTFVDSPAPASTFYHLVGALVELDEALRGRQPASTRTKITFSAT